MKQLIMTIAIVMATLLSVEAQNKYMVNADELYDAGEYFAAIEKYKKAYAKVKNKKEKMYIAFQIGDCNRRLNIPQEAENWYKIVVESKHEDTRAILYYGEVLRMNKNYDDAKEQYEKYLELVPDNNVALRGLESIEKASEWQKEPTRYIVKNYTAFNSEYSEFSPTVVNKKGTELVFTSAREGTTGSEFSDASGANFSDIFYTKQDRKGKWSIPVPLFGDVNSEFDDGSATVDKRFKIMYFTRCIKNKREELGCRIYRAKKSGQLWNKAEELTIVTDSAFYSIGHPSLSSDGLTLYFAGQLNGGHGGRDIWFVTRTSTKDENWSKPKNIGNKINTEGDEVFPFIRSDGTLYFSSNYHVGIGGHDIFKATPQKGSWEIENMRVPVNSSADDFGIFFVGTEEKGYFSSTREDGKGNDDIYSFELPELVFKMEGTVADEESGYFLEKAFVELTGSDGTILSDTTNEKGEFAFSLTPETDYKLLSTKDLYLNGKGEESTKGLTENKTLIVNLLMAPTSKPVELPNILYDLGKADLRPESMVSLDKLIETLEDNPNIVVEIRSHTDFRGSDKSNRDLSLRRAQSVVNYLIKKDISAKRLKAKGHGEDLPNTVNNRAAEKYSFLKENDVLTEKFINSLATKQQKEIAHQINRRTEFQVTATNFFEQPKKDEKDND